MEEMIKLQELYDSEINFSISCFWDGGFDCKLGDTMNGFTEEFTVETLEEAVIEICKEAIKHFPKSKFAKNNPTLYWCCKYCGENEKPKCHKCIREDGKDVSDELEN